MNNARDFNKKETIMTKGRAIFSLALGITFLFPLVLITLLYFFMAIITVEVASIIFHGVFSIFIVLMFINFIVGCVKVIKSKEVITVSQFYEMLNIFGKAKHNDEKNGDGVEGIVEGKEFDLIDANNDGKILISEFYPLTEDEVLNEIVKVDPNFSKTEFKAFVKGVFMLVQQSWSNNNYRALRAFEADSLYYQHKVKIEDLIKRGIVEKYENIRIKGVLLKDFKIDGNKEVMVVALTAKMEITSNESILASDSLDVPYIMKFARNKGVKTKAGVPLSTTNCCNCGAVIDVSDDGICNYCNTSLVSGELEWVLVDIKNIALVKS